MCVLSAVASVVLSGSSSVDAAVQTQLQATSSAAERETLADDAAATATGVY